MATDELEFPCSLTLSIPLPTARLASAALRALSVDAELSPLVRRTFSLTTPPPSTSCSSSPSTTQEPSILQTSYRATTNRMLRVAINGFMESLSVVLGVMEELDVDVLGVEGEAGHGIEETHAHTG